MQVISRIRQELGLQLPLTALFENSTLVGQAALLETMQQNLVEQPLRPS